MKNRTDKLERVARIDRSRRDDVAARRSGTRQLGKRHRNDNRTQRLSLLARLGPFLLSERVAGIILGRRFLPGAPENFSIVFAGVGLIVIAVEAPVPM
jgi:hypothetical protein